MEKLKRRFKTPAGRTDMPIVRKLMALRSGTSSASPQPVASPYPTSKKTFTKASTKPSAKHLAKSSIKSTCKPSHKLPKIPKFADPSEQEAIQVVGIVLSTAPPSAKDIEKALAKQPSKQVPIALSSAKPASKRSSSKRKTSSEQGTKQVPKVDKPEDPKAKKAKPTLSSAAKTVHFLQRSMVRGKVVKVDYFEE